MTSTQAFPPKGRQDTILNEVSSTIRAPVFVDNTVLHAQYTRTRDIITGSTLQIEPPLSTDFQYTHDRKYQIIEETDGARISHPHKPGVKYDTSVYFGGNKLEDSTDQEPLLMFGSGDTSSRLRPTSVQSNTYGSKIVLQNMRERSFEDIEFDETHVRLGQVVGIGFRTTDAAQRLFSGAFHGINSFDVGLTFTGPRAGNQTQYKGADIARHSTRFISQDFYGIGIIEGMFYIGKHDHHTLYYDRFGNLLYAPSIFLMTDRIIGDSKGIASTKQKELMGQINRMSVQGKPMALNDDSVIIVDDMELQKRHGSIETGNVVDPVSRTTTQSRRVAAEALRINKRAQSVIQSEDHIDSWDLDAGDVVSYKAPSSGIQRSVSILHSSHSLKNHSSDFIFVSSETGIEDLLNANSGVETLESVQPDTVSQISTINISNTGGSSIHVRRLVSTFTYLGSQTRTYSGAPGTTIAPAPAPKTINNANPDKHAGMILGHRYSQANITSAIGTTDMTKAARGAIGVGASLSTKITGGAGAQYINGTQLLTVVSTDGFPTTGTIMIVAQDDSLAYSAAYDAITATTFHLTVAIGADKTWTNDARVIYARPRGHELKECRSIRHVVMQ